MKLGWRLCAATALASGGAVAMSRPVGGEASGEVEGEPAIEASPPSRTPLGELAREIGRSMCRCAEMLSAREAASMEKLGGALVGGERLAGVGERVLDTVDVSDVSDLRPKPERYAIEPHSTSFDSSQTSETGFVRKSLQPAASAATRSAWSDEAVRATMMTGMLSSGELG